jgi:23S rRNA maturation mini-RNase III
MFVSKVIQIRGSKKQSNTLKDAAADLTDDTATEITKTMNSGIQCGGKAENISDYRRKTSLGSPEPSESPQCLRGQWTVFIQT